MHTDSEELHNHICMKSAMLLHDFELVSTEQCVKLQCVYVYINYIEILDTVPIKFQTEVYAEVAGIFCSLACSLSCLFLPCF